MIVGKVVGSIVSTRKNDKLIGNKFMIVEPVHRMQAESSQIVAIDNIGAGIGESEKKRKTGFSVRKRDVSYLIMRWVMPLSTHCRRMRSLCRRLPLFPERWGLSVM